MSKIIAIEGAPFSGKTCLAVALARRLLARRAPVCIVGPVVSSDPVVHLTNIINSARETQEMLRRGVIVIRDTYFGSFLAASSVCRGGYIPDAVDKLNQAIETFGLIPPRLMVCLSAEVKVLRERDPHKSLSDDMAANARFAYGNPRFWWNLSDSTCLNSGDTTLEDLADKLDPVLDELVRCSAVIQNKALLKGLTADVERYAGENGMGIPAEPHAPGEDDPSVLSSSQWP